MKSLILIAFLVLPSVILAEDNIVTIASNDKRFSTLVTAVKAAGLVEVLQGDGPFTVLAPTNDAFAKIPKADLDALLAHPDDLKKVLLRHVIPAKVLSKDVVAGPVETAGQEIIQAAVFTSGSGVTTVTFTNDKGVKATVVQADVLASNGVIHAIDTVI